ncbi:hypothetical protein [Pediococcus argentinicus]|uniref:Uncharacterized protein n=1 Tax=Pediococcus argentinicus TaxID=480391 RepID=A0A0R2NA19_9LACO|nr:hypothetical protein [Pediococcus argentinicus]KRO22719.1 hypothetical protein IV88_GL001103 [Pediococcus argentinicus]NKZ23008.1 hypothetical protein [Pediococcus argentinicus]GEP20075.1 hypothetical protein LSA03_14590 [Pediococcus argentinicus]
MKILGWLAVVLLIALIVWLIRAIPRAIQTQKDNAKRIDEAHTKDYQKLGGSWGNGHFEGYTPIYFGMVAFILIIAVICLIGYLI